MTMNGFIFPINSFLSAMVVWHDQLVNYLFFFLHSISCGFIFIEQTRVKIPGSELEVLAYISDDIHIITASSTL